MNILKKYQSIPIPIRASFWFLICSFLQRGISFITTPIFTRLLSTKEYGQFNVFNSWMSIIVVFATLNLYYGVYTRGLVKFEKEKDEFSSSLQGLTLTLLMLWLLLYLCFHTLWNRIFGLTTVQMLLMFILMWTTSVFSFWSAYQRVEFKYRGLVLVTIVVSILKPLVGIIFVRFSEDKVTARILGLVIVEFICYSFFFITQLLKGKKFYSKKFWVHALQFNIPLIPHYLSTSILSGADRIMIKEMIGESEAGIYSLAYSLSMIMTMLNGALMQTLEPWMYKKIASKKIEDISTVAYTSFSIVAVMNIILIAFAPEVVRFFAPGSYYKAIYIIPPVAMSVFFMFSYTFFAVFEFYYQKTKLISVATSVGALLNIILNLIFIDIFGYYAAGYTTLVCYIAYAIFHFIFMRKICRTYLENRQPYSIRVYLFIAISFISLGFIFLFLYKNIFMRYIAIILILSISYINREKIRNAIMMIISMKKEN